MCVVVVVVEGVGGGRGIDSAPESGGPGESGEEEWAATRDLSRSNLNLSSSSPTTAPLSLGVLEC